MPRYLHYNNGDITTVLQWAEDQGPHKVIGLYQAAQDWLIVIEPTNTQHINSAVQIDPPKKKGGRPKGWRKGEPYA